MAQSGLNYPEYVADWLIENNLRVGNPDVTVTALVSGTAVSISGTVKDPDGSITRVDTALKADSSGVFQPKANPGLGKPDIDPGMTGLVLAVSP